MRVLEMALMWRGRSVEERRRIILSLSLFPRAWKSLAASPSLSLSSTWLIKGKINGNDIKSMRLGIHQILSLL